MVTGNSADTKCFSCGGKGSGQPKGIVQLDTRTGRRGWTDWQAILVELHLFSCSGISQSSWSFIALSWPFLFLRLPPAFLVSAGQGGGSILGDPPSLCASCPYCRASGTAGLSGSAEQGFNSLCSMLSGLINLILPLIE